MFIKNKVFKNASWIIICRIVQSVLSMVIAMLTARYLGPSNFGVINYASSITAFVSPIMYLGLNSTLVHELVNNKDSEGEILGTSIVMSLLSAILCIAGIAGFTLVANPNEPTTIIVCVLYSFLLVFQAIDLVQYWFQYKYLSKYASITMLVAYALMSAYKIFLLATGKSIYWFAVSNALEYLVIAFTLIIVYHKLGGQKLSFSLSLVKELFSRSRYYIVSSLMVKIFNQTAKIMLKLMLGDAATGFYSAAAACSTLTSFVFAAIIDSARPSILGSANVSEEKLEENMAKLYSIIIYVSLAQCIAMTLFSDIIINIVYGASYAPAVPALRIDVWHSTFAYLGTVRNVWILAKQKQKYLWIINLGGAIANVTLNFALIPIMGINGAALSALITQIFTNVILGFVIPPIRRNNTLMFKGLNPKYLIDMTKSLLKK